MHTPTNARLQMFTRSAAQQLYSNQRLQRWCFDVELIYLAQQLKVWLLLPVPLPVLPLCCSAAAAAVLRLLLYCCCCAAPALLLLYCCCCSAATAVRLVCSGSCLARFRESAGAAPRTVAVLTVLAEWQPGQSALP